MKTRMVLADATTRKIEIVKQGETVKATSLLNLGVRAHYRLNPRRRHFRLFVSRPRPPNSSGRPQLFSCGLSAKAEQNSK